MSYLRMGIVGSGESRWVEPYYHEDLFRSGYKVESNVIVNQKPPLNLSISVLLVGGEPIDVYENDKKILVIKHYEDGVQTVVAYDEKSPHGLVDNGGLQPWRRDRAGNFHPETIIRKTELLSNYDLWIEFSYDDLSNDKWRDGRAIAYKEGVGLEIVIRKALDYPSVPKLKILPVLSAKTPLDDNDQAGR